MFLCLPDSAWAGENWAEMAWKKGVTSGAPILKSTKSSLKPPWSPCTYKSIPTYLIRVNAGNSTFHFSIAAESALTALCLKISPIHPRERRGGGRPAARCNVPRPLRRLLPHRDRHARLERQNGRRVSTLDIGCMLHGFVEQKLTV